MTDSQQISAIGQAFAEGLRHVLGDNLVGAYIYGAAAFPDAAPTGDVDFHVILRRPLTDVDRAALQTLHDGLARQFPPLGAEMDGYYILLQDAHRREPPQSQMWARARDTAWALHRAHILAGRCITLHGPRPAAIYRPATWPELEAALWAEMVYIESHLGKYPDYCILNLCRLIYSFQTRDVVVSKAFAAEWARERLPPWRTLVALAQKSYAGQGTAEERARMLEEAPQFYAYARKRIEGDEAATGAHGP